MSISKTIIARFGFLAGLCLCLLALSGCNEEIEVHTKSMDRTYLVVEAMLTDCADDTQRVLLTESVDYFEEEVPPVVSGARVSVSDGVDSWLFIETPAGSGCYVGPAELCGVPGVTYKLSIDAVVGGTEGHYEAVSKMEQRGFRLDAVDYMYAGNATMKLDSLWTIAAWGEDTPGANYYYISAKLNDAVFPIELSLAMDDKYFDGQKVIGFPITTLYQTAEMYKQYGEVGKYLETGDVFTLNVYTIPEDYYQFYMGFVSSTVGSSIPMLQSQPANCPTNVTGGDAVGYFVACPVSSASVTIEDPLRPYYKKFFGGFGR
ncbi:MAG: DUF4249 domain-containing protein [Bacteroidales bacterium]|nr:DUF4249 domain-containing protein [Bacteroidales bacterium]